MALATPAQRLLAGVLLLTLLASSMAALYDHKRGFQTYGFSEEDVREHMRQHDPSVQAGKYQAREALKEHPEVQRFLQWKEMHASGHPDAGVAFAGKIPHDYLPLMTQHPEGASAPQPEL